MKYKSKSTQFNGIANYLFHNFDIPRENKYLLSHKEVDKVIENFLTDISIELSKVSEVNAMLVQKNWPVFVKWCKENIERKKL